MAYENKEMNSVVDSMFLTQLNIIAEKYNCQVENIDLENKIVNLDCPNKMTEECALELSSVFKKYLY